MARDAAGIAVNDAELLVPAGTIKFRRLETHGVHVGSDRPDPPCFVLDRRDQLRPKVLTAIFLLDPEVLNEQNRGPDLADDAADNLAAVLERDRDALQPLRPHMLMVVTAEPDEHGLLGDPNGALDGD